MFVFNLICICFGSLNLAGKTNKQGDTEILTAVCVFWETFYLRLKNSDMKNIFLQSPA